MADTIFLDYEIHLRDEARVLELQGNPPGESSTQGSGPTAQRAIIRAPEGAAVEFAGDNGGVTIPILEPGDPIPRPVGVGPGFALGAYIFSRHFSSPLSDVSMVYPTNVATFVRKSGGWFGIPLLFGNTKRFYWRGVFVYDPPFVATDPADGGLTRQVVMKRRWIDPGPGLMHPNDTNFGPEMMNRHAGAWPDTFGFTMREAIFARIHTMTEYTQGLASQVRCSWERLYVCFRKAGSLTTLWRAGGAIDASEFIALYILPTGQIALYNGPGYALIGTTEALEIDRWYKLDIAFNFGGAGFAPQDHSGGGVYPGPRCNVFLDGVSVINFTPAAGVGLGATSFHLTSRIGPTGAGETAQFDIAFWMNAQNPQVFNGIDFMNGSRAVVLRPKAFTAGHLNWTGDVRLLSAFPVLFQHVTPFVTEALTSTTALAELQAETDADLALNVPGTLGVAGIMVCHVGHWGTTQGQLGYKAGAAARVVQTMGAGGLATDNGTQDSPAHQRFMYSPSGGQYPVEAATILPFELHRVKGNDATLARTYGLHAVAELIGIFRDSDYPADFDDDLRYPIFQRGEHMAPYPTTPWATSAAPPVSPVVIKTGTYVGNGTGQDLLFPSPPTFLWIRKTTGATDPTMLRWWSSMTAPSIGGRKQPFGWFMPIVEVDPTFVPAEGEDAQALRYRVRIAGGHLETNRSGDTYHYTSVSDPGMRYSINGAFAASDEFLPQAQALPIATFLPLAALILEQRRDNYGNVEMFFKGPGHAATAMSRLDSGGANNNGVSLAAGAITMETAFGGEQYKNMAFMAMRSDDGSGDVGAHRVFAFGSYVGNGAASRDVVHTVPGLSGRRPIWILVAPNGAWGQVKDCTMPATPSVFVDTGAPQTNGIIAAALNQFTVGIALNENARTYHYMIIWGGETAGNGGMSQCGEFWPVDPDIADCLRIYNPETGLWVEPPGGCEAVIDPPPDDAPGSDGDGGGEDDGDVGGGADDMDTDLSVECKPFTQRLGDIALAKIGITKRLVDLATDVTTEAFAIRLHWAHAVKQTLRDFPWPFATRYNNPTLLGGTSSAPFNRDWRYVYRRPADCVFERRIVTHRTGAVDPTPPPFMLSHDDVGSRIFTNEATMLLEYTARPACTASQADPLFVEAFTWKLAQLMAPGLSKIVDREKYCQERYEECVFVKAPAVIKPGNPGVRPTTLPDTTAAHQAANVAVVNRGLIRIGARTIANMETEQSREAEAARLIFEEELKSTLRDFPWSWATQYAGTLELVAGPDYDDANIGDWSASVAYMPGDIVTDTGVTYWAIAASTNQAPPNATYWTTEEADVVANFDWTYAFRLPTDAIDVRRIVREGYKRGHDPDPVAFRLGQDSRGLVLFTDEANPTIEYTARLAGIVSIGDALFRDAFAWRLAASLAPSLATVDPSVPEQHGRGPRTEQKERKPTEAQLRSKATDYAWRMYAHTIAIAWANNANEQEPQKHTGDPDWIKGRN